MFNNIFEFLDLNLSYKLKAVILYIITEKEKKGKWDPPQYFQYQYNDIGIENTWMNRIERIEEILLPCQ